jgi:hypothetical protein
VPGVIRDVLAQHRSDHFRALDEELENGVRPFNGHGAEE